VAKSTATYLRHTLGVSHRKITRFFHEFFGLRFVPAAALGFDSQAARKGRPLYEDVHSKIKASALVHADETFWRHDGQNFIVWYAGHQDLACFNFTQHRSTKEAQKLLGEHFGGILVADAYASYNGVHPRARQSCLAHLIRKAKELDQTLALLKPPLQEAPARQLCQKAAALFSRACHATHRFQRGEINARQAMAQEKEFRDELASLCRRPLAFTPAETFRQRLLGPEQALFFTCLREPDVPPTNNQAEQSLRPIVILRKVILCTRSQAGLENHSVLHTLIQTARRQGRDVRLFLETLLTANASTAQAALYRNTS
jgi:transposase